MTVAQIYNAAILLERDESQRVNFQVFPDSILDSKQASWTDVTIVARSEPIKTYAGSGARILSFSLFFVASLDKGDDGTAEEDVKKNVEFLQSLVYPDVTESGVVLHPPVVILIVCDLINTRGVVKSVDVQWMTPYTVEEEERRSGQVSSSVFTYFSLPMLAQATLRFEEVNTTPHWHTYVRNGRVR